MPVSLIKPSFAAGELSPSLWGRVDFAKWHMGASVMRNMFVSYRGGSSSRAGMAWCGKSLTPASASSLPPRIIDFQFNIFQSYLLEFGVTTQDTLGKPYMRVIANGAYVTETPVNATAATQANPCVIACANSFANGDWVFAAAFGGMTQLNGRTFILSNVSAAGFTLNDIFGRPVNSLNYSAFGSGSGGGTFARIFTDFDPPYALADLPFLKVVQSADVMTLCCVNQGTGAEYPPIDLQRLAANNWSFATTTFASSIAAPTGCAATTSVTASPVTQYAYCVTAISAATGEESVASNVASIINSDDIAIVAGSHTITWNPVPGAASYNIYQAPPSYISAVPVGSNFAFIGDAFGTQFVNTNIVADQTRTPPLHTNPFARGAVVGATKSAGGASYVQTSTTATVVSATGTGAVLAPVVVSGAVVAIIVQNGGAGYKAGDTIAIADSGGGSGAIYVPQIGPQSGTYPGVPNYFQSRRAYAGTLNNPDTLFFSQTGAYTNMDSAVPPIDSDAIVTTPWGQQVNGIQWLQPMPGGLIVATGLDAWQVAGASGPGSALTPASESAQAQESNGFSPTVPPLKINYDLLYNQALGYVVRDITYNFFTNVYAGADQSLLSNHLFDGFQIVQWAWAQVPWKLVWATRDDGKFLSLTFDKEEQLQGWARHDTNGLVAGCVVATEPPVNAPYFVVKRFILGVNQWAYYIERMDNRLWQGPEDPWCVDAGLALGQPTPAATLTAAAASGPGTITGGYVAATGQGYTQPSAQIFDPLGTGSGAVIMVTQSGGAINGFTIVSAGQNYSPGTTVTIGDPTGAGATFLPFVSQNVLFNASSPVFGGNAPGDVIRIGGGQAVVTTVNNPSQVLAAITVPIVQVIPNDPYRLPVPAAAGNWSITTPVSVVSNLDHLEGMLVTGLADAAVIPPTTVVNGSIALAAPASSITIGLPFTAQLQAMGIEIASLGTVQGIRKLASNCTVRVEKSRGFQVGANQPVASALDFQQEIAWDHLVDIEEVPRADVPAAALPLFTGDKYVNLNDDWQNWNGWEAAPGMLAAQQSQPLPMNITAFVPQFLLGDNAGARG